MLDKDKLWIVVSIDIRGLSKSDITNLLSEFADHFKYDESVNIIIIPSRSETKVSFYNMGNIEPLMLDEFQELIDNIKNNLVENL
jgi:hypothetical protein